MNCEDCKYYNKEEGYYTWLACDGLDCDSCPYDNDTKSKEGNELWLKGVKELN